MSKKLYLLFLYSFFLGNYLNGALSLDEVAKQDSRGSIGGFNIPIGFSGLIQLMQPEASPDITMKMYGGTPNGQSLQFFESDGKSTGISLDIPYVYMKLNIPRDAKLTVINHSGGGIKIELANGKFVNLLLPSPKTLPTQPAMLAIPG